MRQITMDQVGVMSVQYVHYSLEYYLDSMKKCGLKHVDFWGGVPHYCRLDYKTEEEAKTKLTHIRSMLDARGLDVVVYTPETLAYPYSFTSPEKEVRERTVEYFSMAMDDARVLGTDKVFLNSGCGLLDLPREDSFARLVETYKKIAAIAQEKGITLVLEQLQPYESNLVIHLQDIKRVLEEVNSPALYVCVDVVAMAVANETLEEYFEQLGADRIKLIHFADTCHYILGDGELPLQEYIDVLEKYEYKGIVDLEINDSIYWDDPHNSIVKSVEWLKEHL